MSSTPGVGRAFLLVIAFALLGSLTLTFSASAQVPENDDCANAISVCDGSLLEGDLTLATADGESTCEGSTGPDLWYVYQPSVAGNFVVFCQPDATFDVGLAVYVACPGNLDNQIVCEDTGLEGINEQVAGPLFVGQTYLIRVYGVGGSTGTFQLMLSGPTCVPSPDIAISPATLTFTNVPHDPILVEVDWMEDATHNYQPGQDVIDEIVATFDREGFDIQIELSNAIPYQSVLSIPSNSSVSGAPNVAAIKNVYFDHRADPRYHYCLFVRNYSIGGDFTSSSGIADLPGNTFLVSLGSFSGGVGTFRQKVGTFIHELGHNLGQKHGGADHNNWKPNYFSVMNYIYQLGGLGQTALALGFSVTDQGFNEFSYSHGVLPSLNENNLNEVTGIGLGRAVDWNCNGVAIDSNVVKDIGGAGADSNFWCANTGSRTTLADFDNWNSVPNFIRTATANKAFLDNTEPPEICISAEEAADLEATLAASRKSAGATQQHEPVTPAAPKAHSAHFIVSNVGTATLSVGNLSLDVPSPWIEIDPISPFTLEPSESRLVSVTVDVSQAPAGTSQRRILVPSNDADENPYPRAVFLNITNVTPPPTMTPTEVPTTSPTPTPEPTSEPTLTPDPTVTVSPTPGSGRLHADFDDSGCTDLLDFLFLLDNWEQIIDGEVLSLPDFLNLLDYWGLGLSC